MVVGIDDRELRKKDSKGAASRDENGSTEEITRSGASHWLGARDRDSRAAKKLWLPQWFCPYLLSTDTRDIQDLASQQQLTPDPRGDRTAQKESRRNNAAELSTSLGLGHGERRRRYGQLGQGIL